ncbi:GNAT family N-acetyltransferase [Salinibacillus xinjiangensis]|uniref:GNAT family N-acetyltransferase n=1 Tax=Salinibacillus xinjiangensis TaxID=1229268 RepID=A0A6G1X413_9BACI|nr:GNAT family N-acetyltransferase [Salinibacillus xinjiangensis]MRG85687.1 GNAT family N-acetyltransferase [Salinibacillus xinjiangensis]
MLKYVPIDIDKHKADVLRFRKDSFVVSFGDDSGFDQEGYLDWLQSKTEQFPNGFVMVEKDGERVGQLELSIREYDGKDIGYVHLYYLIPEKRGKSLGKELHDYAVRFFTSHQVTEFHLRVSPMNKAAHRFYQKLGMIKVGPELNGKVIRMKENI